MHVLFCCPVAAVLAYMCAGLVFPRFAASKAEMVAAGVIPIDRLTDVRTPIEVAAARCGQQQLEAVYGIQLSSWPDRLSGLPSGPAAGSNKTAAAGGSAPSSSGVQQQQQQQSPGTLLLLGLARARGWAASGGLPDEVRAGRQILKDYTNGKLLYCKLPPGFSPAGFAPSVAPLPGTVNSMSIPNSMSTPNSSHQVPQQQQQQQQLQEQLQREQEVAGSGDGAVSAESTDADDASSDAGDSDSGEELEANAIAAGVDGDASMLLLSEADLELMEGLGIGSKAKPKRPDHKFHKKAARSKGSRGLAADAGGYDGAALTTGKKGGLVRVGGY